MALKGGSIEFGKGDELHRHFDYVMVFKLDDGKQPGICKHCCLAMLGAGTFTNAGCMSIWLVYTD
jgi:hypothetical protein